MEFSKRVADPVHRTIGLSELEVRVINSKAFQRLRNIRQLGLAHFVFPGADYSRFSHSLGVCHITGRILEALRNTKRGRSITDKEIELYRLAGLVHDIGHYPFSHAMEDVLEDFYPGGLVSDTAEESIGEEEQTENEALEGTKYFDHERAGQEIISVDEELRTIFNESEIDPEDVASIFRRTRRGADPQKFANLVSSDLDADRIDYLLRTSHHSGLPYGSVDLDYIISQMRLDSDNRVCIRMKALRAADHMLLSRYFDYLQSTYHKTVTGAELVLKDVILELLRSNMLSCSRKDVSKMVADGTWSCFDEAAVTHKIRALREETDDEVIKTKTSCVLNRTPPKLVWEDEFLASRYEPKTKDLFLNQVQRLKEKREQWAKDLKIEPERLYVWQRNVELTKVGSQVPVSYGLAKDPKDKDRYWQAVRVLVNEETESSEPIMEVGRSLMKVLGDYSIYLLRVYALLKPNETHRKGEIKRYLSESLSYEDD